MHEFDCVGSFAFVFYAQGEFISGRFVIFLNFLKQKKNE